LTRFPGTRRRILPAVTHAGRSALAVLAVLVTWGCDEVPTSPREPSSGDSTARARPRLVVVYAACTVNPAFLSPYDESVSYTPHFDAFASDALVFERHQSEAGTTGIAMASILSGGQALQHGVYGHPQPLEDETLLMAEAFAEAGYETFFYDRHLMASYELNYGQGVEPLNSYTLRVLEPGDRYFAKILEKLKADPEYRAYVQVVISTTHWPYSDHDLENFCTRHPEECALEAGEEPGDFDTYFAFYNENANWMRLAYDFEASAPELGLDAEEVPRFARMTERLYRANISFLDQIFGSLVASIRSAGLLDESLIAFTADHGEVLDRDNAVFRWTHGHALAPEVLGVPWLLRAPELGVAPGRYPGVSRSIDVFPTLAGLAGVPLPANENVTGVDLSPALRGEAPPPELLAFSHTAVLQGAWVDGVRVFPQLNRLYPRPDAALVWVSIRQGDRVYKLQNRGDEVFEVAVFDLADDPDERHDLYDPEDTHHLEMREKLTSYKALLVEDWRKRSGRGEQILPQREQIELLKSIGYIP
jgi:arylsulfatase A-like enzyme